jgi:hypothetical protein
MPRAVVKAYGPAYIRDVLAMLCGFTPHWERRLIMFQAFWDESGTHDKELLILAGFVGEAGKWVSFTEHWQAVLTCYKVASVHMKDFKNPTRGVFKHLTRSQRANLYSELLAIIKETVSMGFVCSVHQPEFETIVRENSWVSWGQRLPAQWLNPNRRATGRIAKSACTIRLNG